MKKLPITKESFEKSKYFTNKYGKLEYVSESGKLFKTNKGKILKFNESFKDVKKSVGNVLKNSLILYLPKKGDIFDMWHYYHEWKAWCFPSDAEDAGEPVWKVEVVDRSMAKDSCVVELKLIRNKDAKHRNLKVGDCVTLHSRTENIGTLNFIVDGIDGKTVSLHRPSDEEIKKFRSTKEQRKEMGITNPEDLEDTENLIQEDDEWDDAIFKPSNELQKLYKELKAKYGKGDIEIRLADMQFGKFWLVVEVPEEDVKTLDKMEKILKSKCEGNENWEVFREEHLYGDVSYVAIQEEIPDEDKDDKKKPISKPKPPFMGIKGTQDHGSFIMYRNAAIEKDELFEGIQAMLDDEGIDVSAEEWASDPKNKREVRDFLVDYARFA